MTPPLGEAAGSAIEKEYTGASRARYLEDLVGPIVVIAEYE